MASGPKNVESNVRPKNQTLYHRFLSMPLSLACLSQTMLYTYVRKEIHHTAKNGG